MGTLEIYAGVRTPVDSLKMLDLATERSNCLAFRHWTSPCRLRNSVCKANCGRVIISCPCSLRVLSDNNAEEQEQVKSPYVKSLILHYNDDTHTEEPVGQTSPNANTYDTPAPTFVKTIYDRFDKQEEFPNEYLGFNHSSKRKAPPTCVNGTLIQPGQARHAARVSKLQEDDRLSKVEDAKTDIHYDRLKEQWSQFNDDKKEPTQILNFTCLHQE